MKLFTAWLLLIGITAHAQSALDSTQLMRDIRTLSDNKFEGRRTGTRGSRMAQFYLLDRFKQIGLQPYHNTYEYSFYFQEGPDKRTMGTNLFGYIKGSKEDVIVVTAHYDHLGIRSGAKPDSIYNGADDNASGVGGLLALMAYYAKHPPVHTLIFVAFDGEEEGLQGAKAFLQQPPVPARQMILNINMDMVSRNDNNQLYVCGLTQNPQLKSFVDAGVNSAGTVKLIPGHDNPDQGHDNWLNQSDQYEFYQMKIPMLYFGVEDHPDYHKPSDEFEHIQPAFYYQAIQRVLSVLEAADKGL